MDADFTRAVVDGHPVEGGFDFSLYNRNMMLSTRGLVHPSAKKTGTTIAGILVKDAVVLGADTRATSGATVCDKNCEKIHYIAPNIFCCGAGTSADTENTTALISSKLELLRQATGRPSRVVTSLTLLQQYLFRYQGHVSAALVLGGVDSTGPHLHTVYPHGSTDTLPYVTMGSGSLAAMAVFEARYVPDLSIDEGIALVADAIKSGIFNDLGSGSNVDICVITANGRQYHHNYEQPNQRKYRSQRGYAIPRGTTPVSSESIVDIRSLVVVEEKSMEDE
eukprot:TRINITY_DN1089_c0_g1_i1.p1 TRINITY_DN1089_c0_g1~~TRINITY_DN1089_c0_g1_i1.p1  ORF type:complete len:289 (+),score=118.11 TRINITY_DN1089_c0_g1_i1:32-868(+)